MVVNTFLIWFPRAIRTDMATTEMKARIRAYSTRVWPFLLFIRRKALLALVITLLIIVYHLLSLKIFYLKWCGRLKQKLLQGIALAIKEREKRFPKTIG